MLQKWLILVALLSACGLANAEIIETNSMKDALSIVQAGDLVVFDIDNTILEPVQSLGSDQWYSYNVEKFKKDGLSENEAINKALAMWVEVQYVIQERPVETVTPELIKSMQKKGIQVLALTARPLELKDHTIEALKSVDVELSAGDLKFPNPAEEVVFNKGVILVGPRNNKGLVLADFIKQSEFNPKRVIFLDDKVRHVNNMEKVFADLKIPNINYRYSATDERVKSLNPAITDVQWQRYIMTGEVISDEEAKQIIEGKPKRVQSMDCLISNQAGVPIGSAFLSGSKIQINLGLLQTVLNLKKTNSKSIVASTAGEVWDYTFEFESNLSRLNSEYQGTLFSQTMIGLVRAPVALGRLACSLSL